MTSVEESTAGVGDEVALTLCRGEDSKSEGVEEGEAKEDSGGKGDVTIARSEAMALVEQCSSIAKTELLRLLLKEEDFSVVEGDDCSGVASAKRSRTNDVVFETVSTLYLVEGVIKRRADSGGDVVAERVINGYNSFGGSSGSSSSAGGGSVSTGGGLAGGNVGGQERLKWKLLSVCS